MQYLSYIFGQKKETQEKKTYHICFLDVFIYILKKWTLLQKKGARKGSMLNDYLDLFSHNGIGNYIVISVSQMLDLHVKNEH